jgi:hypothetical protein
MTDAAGIPADEFELRPIIIPVATALFVGTADSFLQLPLFASSSFWLELLCTLYGIPALLVWLIVMLLRLVKAAGMRTWRKATAQLLILVWVWPLMFFALSRGPYVHFGLSYPYYMWQVKQSSDGGTTPITFNWGASGLVGSAQTDRWLVYDPTNETAARPRISPDPESPDNPNSWSEVEHLIGRFYLVEHHQI